MVNTYYTRKGHIDVFIQDYLENVHPEEWVRVEKPSECTTLVDMNYCHYFENPIIPCKIMSHMGGLEMLGNKRKLYLTMKKHNPKSFGDYIPKTYLLDPECTSNLQHIFDGRKYIVKPGHRECRHGIFLTKDYKDLCDKLREEIIKERARDEHDRQMNPVDDWIIQEYVENPLLYEGKKFHFRVYVLLLNDINGIRVYVFDKIIMISSKYKYDDTKDESQLSGGRGGNHLFPGDFTIEYGEKNSSHVMKQICNIVASTVLPVFPYIKYFNHKIKENITYKLISYDIVIDDNYKCYLCEINTRNSGTGRDDPIVGWSEELLWNSIMDLVLLPNKKNNFVMCINRPLNVKKNTRRKQLKKRTKRIKRKKRENNKTKTRKKKYISVINGKTEKKSSQSE